MGDSVFVITADQIRSHAGEDLVPSALRTLRQLRPALLRAFERTAGDEIQGVTDDADLVVGIVERLVRQGRWRIGIGVGPVELPLPASTRAGRGGAFRAARGAVDAAHPKPGQLAVRVALDADEPLAQRRSRHGEYAESALLLYAHLLRGRSAAGWEVVDLLAQGLTQSEAGQRLGVSASAVSQRVRRAAWEEQRQGARLVVHHLSGADDRPESDEGSGDDDGRGAAGWDDPAVRPARGLPRRPGDDMGVRPPGPA
ncbi:MAG: sigma factor-like helix-turn-helix DNA-binding protein [Dermatophilaceae bacterium]